MPSVLEQHFEQLWLELYPEIDLEAEFKFHPHRKFRLDYAHVPSKTGIEINGGRWQVSGHSSGRGLFRDYEKINLAILEGWVIFQLCDEMINYQWLEKIARHIRG